MYVPPPKGAMPPGSWASTGDSGHGRAHVPEVTVGQPLLSSSIPHGDTDDRNDSRDYPFGTDHHRTPTHVGRSPRGAGRGRAPRPRARLVPHRPRPSPDRRTPHPGPHDRTCVRIPDPPPQARTLARL